MLSEPVSAWSRTDDVLDVVWLEGSEGNVSSVNSCLDPCLSTSQSGRNSFEDLNSVERGRSLGRDGWASWADGVCGADGDERATPGEAGGIRKWTGIAVVEGEECGDWLPPAF